MYYDFTFIKRCKFKRVVLFWMTQNSHFEAIHTLKQTVMNVFETQLVDVLETMQLDVFNMVKLLLMTFQGDMQVKLRNNLYSNYVGDNTTVGFFRIATPTP